MPPGRLPGRIRERHVNGGRLTSHSYCLNQQDSSRPTERAKGKSRGDQPGVLMNPAINLDCDSRRGPSQAAVVARPRGTRGPATARCVLKIQVSRALSDAGSVRELATDGAGFGGRCHATRPNGPASRMAANPEPMPCTQKRLQPVTRKG